jgi:cytochrome c5
MSQDHNAHDDEGPIKTPKQLIVTVVLSFVLPIIVIVLLVNYVTTDQKESAGSNLLTTEAVAERIKPVSTVVVKAAAAAPGATSGEEVYKTMCAACHDSGALGSPKFGDAAAWGPRIGQGLETLWKSAMEGKNAMPAQGAGEFTPDEIKRAVVHMANAGGATFEAPPVAAAEAASDAPAEAASAP